MRLALKNLRTNMGVQPYKCEVRLLAHKTKHLVQLIGVEAKFTIQVTSADVFMGMTLNARSKPQHNSDPTLPLS